MQDKIYIVELRELTRGGTLMDANVMFVASSKKRAFQWCRKSAKEKNFCNGHFWFAIYDQIIDSDEINQELYFVNKNGNRVKNQPLSSTK